MSDTIHAAKDQIIEGRTVFHGEMVPSSAFTPDQVPPLVRLGWLAYGPPSEWLAAQAAARRRQRDADDKAKVKADAADKRALAMSKLAEAEKLEAEAQQLEAEANRLDPPQPRPAQAAESNRAARK